MCFDFLQIMQLPLSYLTRHLEIYVYIYIHWCRLFSGSEIDIGAMTSSQVMTKSECLVFLYLFTCEFLRLCARQPAGEQSTADSFLLYDRHRLDKPTDGGLTDALRQRLVPLSRWLAGEHRRAEQVVAGVAVVEHHRAEGEVAVLDFALADGVGRDPRVGAVDHCAHDTHARGERKRRCVIWQEPARVTSVDPLFFATVSEQRPTLAADWMCLNTFSFEKQPIESAFLRVVDIQICASDIPSPASSIKLSH